MDSELPERDHLDLLLRVNSVLSSTLGLEQALDQLIAQVIEALGAERGFVVLPRDGEWVAVATHFMPSQEGLKNLSFSRTVVEQVVGLGQPLLTLDAIDTEQFYAPSVTLQGIRSILCTPLRWGDKVRGAVYVDHKIKTGAFTQAQMRLLGAISDQASRSLENAALYDELQRVHRENLTRVPAESQAGGITLDFALSSLGDPEATQRWSRAIQELRPRVVSDEPKARACVQISLLGPLRVMVAEKSVPKWSSRKDRSIFCYLATQVGREVHEETLMELFWPSKEPDKARHSLHNSVTQIRKCLGEQARDVVQRRFDGYILSQDCWTDLVEFESFFESARRAVRRGEKDAAVADFQRAESLVRGEFLEGMLEDWLLEHRAQLALQSVECRTFLADDFQSRGKHLLALEIWQRVLRHDNCSEDAYRGTLVALRELGRRTEAARVYEVCLQAYREELDIEPPEGLSKLMDF